MAEQVQAIGTRRQEGLMIDVCAHYYRDQEYEIKGRAEEKKKNSNKFIKVRIAK